jgi:hypothetical protein
MRGLFLLLVVQMLVWGSPFQFIKKDGSRIKPTLLVIGGIHGNEPGGYFAPAFLAQYYTVTEGNLWIVPDLNRPSMVANARGINGDMNRKFNTIDSKDPDLDAVKEIKKIITNPQVDLILNLHDGHGFYRKNYENTIFNPKAWGQTCVIDQQKLGVTHPYGNLDEIAEKVSQELNNELTTNTHQFGIRNTNTRFDDEAMRRSLTYFAITHNKPAFAIETSKNIAELHYKVFYQLRAIESYMRIMGIVFSRSFELTPEEIQKRLSDYGTVRINDTMTFELNNIKKTLNFIPLSEDENTFVFSHPLGNTKMTSKGTEISIGNQKISILKSENTPKCNHSDLIDIRVDGTMRAVSLGEIVDIDKQFTIVNNDPKVRVNVIGFSRETLKNEKNIEITRDNLDSKYALDTTSRAYRVEFYEGEKFCGALVVKFPTIPSR